MTMIRTYCYVNAHKFALFLLGAFGHVCRLAFYDIRSSYIVKETSIFVCHLHKGNNKYAYTFTTAQADLSLSGRFGVWGNFKL